MTLAVKLSRPMLVTPGDNDLTISDHPGSDLVGMWIPEDGLVWPSFAMRRAYPTASDVIGGNVLKSAVEDMGQTTLIVKFRAASTAALFTLRDELAAATKQFTYTLTITIDGTSRAWEAHAELPQWGEFDSGEWKARMDTATIVIPLNPPASGA